MNLARLERWSIGENDCLYGHVYGHPNFADGTFVTTSRVVSYDPKWDKAVTKNTTYLLGKTKEESYVKTN